MNETIEQAEYVDTFFRELSPVWINYVAALHGLVAPRLDGAFTYLELGCGFGQSSIVDAAALPAGQFHACDGNSSHVEGARRYARALGIANVHLLDCTFGELPVDELPEFDYVVLHGVYSWIGARAREDVRRVLERKVKPGGLVYVSYNCLPGWILDMPLRRLLRELVDARSGDDSAEAIDEGLAWMQRLRDANSGYFAAHPSARALVDAYTRYPRGYLVHEYLGNDWEPSYSVDVADAMQRAGLSYVGSATLSDNHPPLLLADDVISTIAEAADVSPTSNRRRLCNQSLFRRDVYVRGDASGRNPARLSDVVVGALDPSSIERSVRVPRGIVTFQDAFIDELRRSLAAGPQTLGSLTRGLGRGQHGLGDIARNLNILLAAGELLPFAHARPFGWRNGGDSIDTITTAVLAHAVEHRVARAIPSPLLGNGVVLDPLAALGVRELLRGTRDPVALSQRILAEVQARRWPDETLANAPDRSFDPLRAATDAIQRTLPLLQRLGATSPHQ